MVPMQTLVLEHHIGDDGKDHERHTLLNDLELYERERSSVLDKTYTISRHLTTILKESYAPGEGYYANEWPC